MSLKVKYNAWKKRRMIKKAQRMMKSKGVRRAKITYWYLILSGLFGFIYGISCIFHDYSFWYAFAPIGLFVVYLIGAFFYRNFKMILVFLTSSTKGRLLHVLNQTTEWSYEHKMKVINWVYPRNRTRRERALELMNKVTNGEELSPSEKKEMRKRRVFCPQQILDGINKAIFVNALIYANIHIQPLDEELRKIMELTPENISKFDFQAEINKCKVNAEKEKIEEYRRIGMKKLNK